MIKLANRLGGCRDGVMLVVDDKRKFTLSVTSDCPVPFQTVVNTLESSSIIYGLKIDRSAHMLEASWFFGKGAKVRDKWVDLAIDCYLVMAGP